MPVSPAQPQHRDDQRPRPAAPAVPRGQADAQALPYVPLAGHVRVGVAIFSYDGRLYFGITGDYDTAPDIRVLCQGIRRGMAELLEIVGEPRSAAATEPPAAGAQAPASPGAAAIT